MRFRGILKKLSIAICIVTLGLCVVAFGVSLSSENGINHVDSNRSGDVILKEKIFGMTIITGNNIRVDGEIDGTVFVFGNGIDINSNIIGDLICFGNNVRANGEINGNSYLFAQTVEFNGKITRDLIGFGATVSVNKDGMVERDMLAFAATNNMLGNVGGNYTAYGNMSNVDGTVGGDVHIEGNMSVGNNSVIKGGLTQVNDKEDKIADGAKVSGEVKYTYKSYTNGEVSTNRRIWNIIRSFMFSIILGVIIWLLVIFFVPSFIEKGATLLERPLQIVGLGALIFIVVPIVSIIAFITVVGIPIGVIALILYGILIYLSKYITSIVIGNFIVRRFNLKSFHNNFWYVLGAFVVLILLSKVPYLNVILSIACICIAFGVVFYRNYKNAYIGN